MARRAHLLGVLLGLGLLLPRADATAGGGLRGCVQIRWESAHGDRAGFSVRRAKVWKKGRVAGAPGWSYKLQMETDSRRRGRPHLQDAYAEFRSGRWRVRFGQMVPEFSLERSQWDCYLPVAERSRAVNALHPGAETDCRDIGAAVTLDTLLGGAHVSLGLFNGTGANRLAGSANGGMVVGRLFWRLQAGSCGRGHVGASFMRRRAHEQTFRKIFGDGRLFSGTDTRLGVEVSWRVKTVRMQAEMLRGTLGRWRADGGYALAAWQVGPDLELVGYAEIFRSADSRKPEERETGLGCVWQSRGNSVRWLAFAAEHWSVSKWLVVRLQLQVLLN